MRAEPISLRYAAGQVRHVFTHFELRLDVLAARVPAIQADGFLCGLEELEAQALPTVMRKGVAAARAAPL